VQAAIFLFSDAGIHGTRIEDITERTDLGKGAFYNYFESKDALVAEIVRRGVLLLDENYLSRLGPPGSLDDRIPKIAREHEAFFDEHPEYLLLFHQARGLRQVKPGGDARLREVFADYLARIGRLLPLPETGAPWTHDQILDAAAAVAGALAGYRSFRVAAGLPARGPTAASALAHGLPRALSERKGS